jgi:cobalt-zinc-cadmium efflux system outer membrane protein
VPRGGAPEVARGGGTRARAALAALALLAPAALAPLPAARAQARAPDARATEVRAPDARPPDARAAEERAAEVRGVTFDEAIGLGAGAPEVEGERRALAARRNGDRRLPGMAGNPEVFVMPGWRLTPSGNEGLEVQVSVAQPLSLAGLPGARRRAAAREREELGARVRARALERRLAIARAWLDLRVAEEQLDLAAREQEVAAGLAAGTGRLVGTGERSLVAEREARTYQAEVALRRLDAEGRAYETRVALAAALAAGPRGLSGAAVRTAGAWPSPELPQGAALGRLAARALDLPDVVAARLAAAVARARGAEAEAAAGAVLSPGVYVQRDSPGGLVLYGMLTATLPVFDRGQRARSVAAGEAERLAGEARRREIDARALLVRAVHEVQHQRERERALAEDLEPQTAALLALEERLLASGEAAPFRVFEARRRFLEVARRRIDAHGARVWAEVELWLLLAALDAPEAL